MSRKEYTKLVIKALKFIMVLLVIDFALGSLLKQFFFAQQTGKYARITHSINEAAADIMIFGSSRANQHYVPEVFEKEFHQRAYNYGVLGQELIFHVALQKMVLKRTKPKLIILNVDKNWLYESEKAYDGLRDLYPYYWQHRDVLRPIFLKESKLIDLQLFFKSYQYNSTIVHALKYYLAPQLSYDGYVPAYRQMKPPATAASQKVKIPRPVNKDLDTYFISAFESFIDLAREQKIELVFAISPNLYKTDYSKNRSLNELLAITDKYEVPLFDFSNDNRFLYRYDLFNDRTHMNDKGARLFSEILSENIKKAEIISNKKWARQNK